MLWQASCRYTRHIFLPEPPPMAFGYNNTPLDGKGLADHARGLGSSGAQ